MPPPFKTTIPDPSKPGEQGGFLLVEYFPFKNALSAGFIGTAMTLIKTWPDYGFGIGKPYLTIGSFFQSSIMIAFIVSGTFKDIMLLLF